MLTGPQKRATGCSMMTAMHDGWRNSRMRKTVLTAEGNNYLGLFREVWEDLTSDKMLQQESGA